MIRLLSVLLPLALAGLAAFGRQPVGIAFYDVDRIYDTIPALFYDDSDYTPEGVTAGTRSATAAKSKTPQP